MTDSSSTLQNRAIFPFMSCGSLAVAAAEQDVGLDADFAQFLDRVLGRLGLQFAGGADIGDQGEVDIQDIFVAAVGTKLADRFQEGERLDVADRTADFDDGDIRALGIGQNLGLDLVGDVRNDLHRAAQVVAAALLLDDRVVDLAGGEVADRRERLAVV